jgi:hypothetical protein
MSGTRFEVSPWRFVAALAIVASFAACGGGTTDEGAMGKSGDAGGGGQQAGGSGGTANTGGAAGASNTGGGMAPAGGMAGSSSGMGGATVVVEASKEKVWIDDEITFGPNSSINHKQPDNWFSPIDYYHGTMEVRAIVASAPTGYYGIELCLYKSGPNDAKHDCLPLLYKMMGSGTITRTQPRTDIILRNALAQSTVTEADFMTPWASNNTRLVGGDHQVSLPGPVKIKLTIVLVPKGGTFSGWSKYPPK